MEVRYDILIADTEEAAVQVLSNALKPISGRLDAAGTADQAFLFLNKREYDVVIMDINMPCGSMLELLKQIGRMRPSAEVLVSADNSNLDRLQDIMKKTGVGGLVKPFDMKDLVKSVEQIIKRKKTLILEIEEKDLPGFIKLTRKKFPDIIIRR